jgi:hypothetical protein
MNILIIGLGTIGSIYGYLFHKAGHKVEHFLRKDSPKTGITELKVVMLDGRLLPKGEAYTDTYPIAHCSQKAYDFIFVSVPSGGIEGVLKSLQAEGITGQLLLCCGLWEDRKALEKLLEAYHYIEAHWDGHEMLQKKDYILGYPVAGGNIEGDVLNGCVFDHFMLEKESKAGSVNYTKLKSLFADAQLKLECPYDMLEWIQLHLCINAAVQAVAGSNGNIHNTSAAAEALMQSSKQLKQVVRTIRETSKIAAARGIDLKHYRNELWAYHLPTFISVPLMKRMFAKNILTRKIMTLHNNLSDLLYVCKTVYDFGKEKGVKAPIFYTAYEKILEKV